MLYCLQELVVILSHSVFYSDLARNYRVVVMGFDLVVHHHLHAFAPVQGVGSRDLVL